MAETRMHLRRSQRCGPARCNPTHSPSPPFSRAVAPQNLSYMLQKSMLMCSRPALGLWMCLLGTRWSIFIPGLQEWMTRGQSRQQWSVQGTTSHTQALQRG
ncbi:hypothetical protein VPH35_094765 [Triticum aestivum]